MLIRTPKVVPILLIALVAPGLAVASSEWHESSGDAGYTFHPDHVKGTKTRAQVMQELEDAKADGSFYRSYYTVNEGVPYVPQTAGPGKTRAEVLKELENITLAERAQMKELYSPR